MLRKFVSPSLSLGPLGAAFAAIALASGGPTASASTSDMAQSPATASSYEARISYLGRDGGWQPLGIDHYRGHIFLAASIGGRSASMLLDNGFTHSAVDASFARRLGIPIEGTGKLVSSGTGAVSMRLAPHVAIDLPHEVHIATALAVIDFSRLAGEIDHPLDGVLGGDLLGHMAVGIYPAAKRLILMPSGSIEPRPGIHSREVPLVAGDHIDARINGRKVRLRVDLGSDSMVTLSDNAWNAILGDRAGGRSGSAVRVEGNRLAAKRVGGNTLAFSGFAADGVVVDHSGALPGDEQGLIGLGILGRTDLIVDFPAGKLILLERPTPAT